MNAIALILEQTKPSFVGISPEVNGNESNVNAFFC